MKRWKSMGASSYEKKVTENEFITQVPKELLRKGATPNEYESKPLLRTRQLMDNGKRFKIEAYDPNTYQISFVLDYYGGDKYRCSCQNPNLNLDMFGGGKSEFFDKLSHIQRYYHLKFLPY